MVSVWNTEEGDCHNQLQQPWGTRSQSMCPLLVAKRPPTRRCDQHVSSSRLDTCTVGPPIDATHSIPVWGRTPLVGDFTLSSKPQHWDRRLWVCMFLTIIVTIWILHKHPFIAYSLQCKSHSEGDPEGKPPRRDRWTHKPTFEWHKMQYRKYSMGKKTNHYLQKDILTEKITQQAKLNRRNLAFMTNTNNLSRNFPGVSKVVTDNTSSFSFFKKMTFVRPI